MANPRRLRGGPPSPARVSAVGAVVIAVLIGAVVFAFRAHSGLPVGTFTYAKAAFDDVGPLLEGDAVRINSVRVGRVDAIEIVDQRAVVTLELTGDRVLYRDATARTVSRSALGQKFVEIGPGTPTSGPLGDAIIETTSTRAATELDELLDVFDSRTRDALTGSVRELGGGAAGHGQDLQEFLAAAPAMLPNLGTTAEALASDEANLAELLDEGRTLAGRFADREQRISELITNFDQTLRGIGVDDGRPLGEAISVLPDTLDRANTAFLALNGPLADTESALANLRGGAGSLGEATPDIRGVLAEAPVPLAKVPGVAELADPAVEELTPAVSDLRPLAPKLADSLSRLRTPLAVLAPYSKDIALMFVDVNSALSQGDGDKHWLRLQLVPTTEVVSGVVPGLEDPLVSREPYPEPGESRTLRERSVVGER